MIHIPFGSMLVARSDVWHGGILGGKGNIRFHATMTVHEDSKDTDELVYGCIDVATKELLTTFKWTTRRRKFCLGKRSQKPCLRW